MNLKACADTVQAAFREVAIVLGVVAVLFWATDAPGVNYAFFAAISCYWLGLRLATAVRSLADPQ